jgi:hypothetical protein
MKKLIKGIVTTNCQGILPLLVLGGLGYLAFALAMNIVIRIYLVRDLWVRVLGLKLP